MSRVPRALGLAGADVVLLVSWYPKWSELAADVRHPHPWIEQVGTDQAAVVLAEAGLWLAALWLGSGLLLCVGSALPGASGSACAGLARRVLPVALQRLVIGAAGVSVLTAPLPALAATDHGPVSRPMVAVAADHSTVDAVRLDRGPAPADESTARRVPDYRAVRSAPAITWPTDGAPTPTTPNHPPTPNHPGPPSRGATAVTVVPGDSLWAIAGRQLGPNPTADQIAATWPQWYAANRTAVGADPNLIQPGTTLHAPDKRG